MIGTAASNLVTAVLFIFVSRLYDVGDRVHIYDGSETVGVQPMNVTVSKIDLRTTSFRRWDEQVRGVLLLLLLLILTSAAYSRLLIQKNSAFFFALESHPILCLSAFNAWL